MPESEVSVFNSVDAIGKESMDSIADDGFFTYGYFKTLERTKTIKSYPSYLVITQNGKTIAVATCFINPRNQVLGPNGRIPFAQKIALAVNRLGFNQNNVEVCHSPDSFHSKILIEKGCSEKRILFLISKKIDDICKKEKILFSSFPYVSESDRILMKNLGDFGYVKYPSATTYYLDIEWSSFDDYVKSLGSHKIKKNVRREIKKCEESGVSIVEENEYGDISTTLSDLHSNLFSKYNKDIENPRDASFFRLLSEYAKDRTRVLVAKRLGKIVGFSLFFQHKGIFDVSVCGFDYNSQTKTDFTYFNLIYYAPIRLAIQEGITRIHFSINSDLLKLRRGCKSEKMYSLVKCHNRLLGPLFTLYMRRIRAR